MAVSSLRYIDGKWVDTLGSEWASRDPRQAKLIEQLRLDISSVRDQQKSDSSPHIEEQRIRKEGALLENFIKGLVISHEENGAFFDQLGTYAAVDETATERYKAFISSYSDIWVALTHWMQTHEMPFSKALDQPEFVNAMIGFTECAKDVMPFLEKFQKLREHIREENPGDAPHSPLADFPQMLRDTVKNVQCHVEDKKKLPNPLDAERAKRKIIWNLHETMRFVTPGVKWLKDIGFSLEADKLEGLLEKLDTSPASLVIKQSPNILQALHGEDSRIKQAGFILQDALKILDDAGARLGETADTLDWALFKKSHFVLEAMVDDIDRYRRLPGAKVVAKF